MKYFQFAFSFGDRFALRLQQQQKCILQASQSAILSIASFIIWKYPHLAPPNTQQLQQIELPQYNRYPSEELAFHPYYELWTDFINDCVLDGRAVLYGQTLYIQIPTTDKLHQEIADNNDEMFETKQIDLKQYSKRERVELIFGLPQNEAKRKRVAIFLNGIIKNKADPTLPKVNAAGLFIGSLYNNEQWHAFKIPEGQIPSIQQIANFDCIILTGSTLSVLNLTPEISLALANLIQAYRINDKLKIIGVCFGHQLIAQHFHAKVEKKIYKGGLEKVELDQANIARYRFLEPLSGLKEGLLTESHEDYVETVPQGFFVIGRSKSCKVQILVSQNGRIFTTQFHSEYLSYYTKMHTHRLQHYYHYNPLGNFYVPSDPQSEEENWRDSQLVRECFRNLISM